MNFKKYSFLIILILFTLLVIPTIHAGATWSEIQPAGDVTKNWGVE